MARTAKVRLRDDPQTSCDLAFIDLCVEAQVEDSLAGRIGDARSLFNVPLRFLSGAFADLDRGITRPALQQTTRAHGAPSSTPAVNFKVSCVLAAEEIYTLARQPGKVRLSRQEAYDKVRARVRRVAESLGLTVGEATIAGWRSAIGAAGNDDLLASCHRTLKGIIKAARPNHEIDWVEWLLGQNSPPYPASDNFAPRDSFGGKPPS
jgi:hypothetical protein